MNDFFTLQAYWTTCLIVHGLLAVALLGAITHQATACWSLTQRTSQSGFAQRFKTVSAKHYTHAVVVLWVLCFVLGGYIYSEYRISVRPPMEQQAHFKTMGAFELKEHWAVIGLGLLPAYWWSWKHDHLLALRRPITVLLAALAWYSFLAGHVVNNVRGYA
jgi:hypothetical protein